MILAEVERTKSFWHSDVPGEMSVPVARPRLPTADQIEPYLRRIDERRWYSNGGPLVQEFEARCHLQLEDTDVANDVIRTRAAISTVPKKSKLTQWLEKFEVQRRVTMEEKITRVPEYQEPHGSQLTAWLTHFEVKHQDKSLTASCTA